MKKLASLLAAAATICLAVAAWATPYADIAYDYTKMGNTYTFNLTVKNTNASPLDYFQINLDADAKDNYSNIAWLVDKGWVTSAAEPDPSFGGLPGVVTADDSILVSGGGGIGAGETLSGFKFRFDYAGSLAPSQQTFSYLASFGTYFDNSNPLGYSTILEESGNIRYFHPDNGNNPVPEPGTVVLLGVGLAGMGLYLRRRQN